MTIKITAYTADDFPPGTVVDIDPMVASVQGPAGNYLFPSERLTRMTVEKAEDEPLGVMLSFVGQSRPAKTNASWVRSIVRKGPAQ